MAHKHITTREKDSRGEAHDARLRYVSDGRPGFQRKRRGTSFRYVTADGKQVNRVELKRIRELAIPPAWDQAWICPHPNGHLQATGRDAKGSQTIHLPSAVARRAQGDQVSSPRRIRLGAAQDSPTRGA